MGVHERHPFFPIDIWQTDGKPVNAKPPTNEEAAAIAELFAGDPTLGPVGIAERLKIRRGITVSHDTVRVWYQQTQQR